jgi:hypothetical protein
MKAARHSAAWNEKSRTIDGAAFGFCVIWQIELAQVLNQAKLDKKIGSCEESVGKRSRAEVF